MDNGKNEVKTHITREDGGLGEYQLNLWDKEGRTNLFIIEKGPGGWSAYELDGPTEVQPQRTRKELVGSVVTLVKGWWGIK
jgi:hypothetical protein